jgi:hypothetical protein
MNYIEGCNDCFLTVYDLKNVALLLTFKIHVLQPDSLLDWISFSKTTIILSACCNHIFSGLSLFLQNIYLLMFVVSVTVVS